MVHCGGTEKPKKYSVLQGGSWNNLMQRLRMPELELWQGEEEGDREMDQGGVYSIPLSHVNTPCFLQDA